jgi:glycosyltransferase involved in cell wall biosynthesis
MLVPLILRLHRLGILYAMTVHGRYSHVFDESKRTVHRVSALYLQLVERWLLEGALFVQALSAVEREVIRRIAPNARIEVVPNAAYSSRFEGTPLPPKRIGPSARFPVFGFLGRYAIEHKGLDVLVSGFAAYRKAGRKGSLELVGTGPSRDTLAAMARDLGVGEYVTLDGPRFGSEKARTLASWDYFVMSSRYEGIPIGALEAGLSGLPLILSAGTGLREQVVRFKAGFGIEALTTEGMARAFERAGNASAHEWSAMSAAAYRLGLSVGDWSSTAAQLMRLYQAV